ncbi:M48 family metalloprotease [Halorubellus sp. PRR65]|uniref:M48 family metalloprotease n=1 Tax=Halorubellus sp. PRR65 TaxID=3098148 RepID=UPI002B259124|nr:M48 family metalloprotease [Halorubellus sp. PRR65]
MSSRIESSLRRRMLATTLLFAGCAAAFLGALAVLYGYVVPALVGWWSQRFDLASEIGLVAVLVPAGVVCWLAIGTVRNFYASPLSETDAVDAPEADHPELYAAVRRLAQQADVPAPDLKLVESSVPNAYTVGFTPSSSTIVVTTGLLDTLDSDELHAVLAHELAHVTNRDGAVMSVGYLLPAVAFAFAKALTSPFESDEEERDGDDVELGPNGQRRRTRWSIPFFGTGGSSGSTGGSSGGWDGGDDGGDGGGIIVAILVLVAIMIATAIMTLAISTFFWVFSSLTLLLLARTREYAADYGAVELTGDPDALASALSKLDDELANAPLRDIREIDGAVETLYVMPLRRGLHGFSDVVLLSDDLFPNTHPDTETRIDRVFEAADDT